MIISEIKWGLGNQLFQYAAGLSLARHHNVPLILDTSSYDEDDHREFCLNYFEIDDIKTEIATDTDDEVCFNLYIEPFFHFDKTFFDKPNFTYLTGCWQTEKYFKNIAPEIRKRFRIKPQYLEHLKVDDLAFDKFESVNLHIRRTDYAIHTMMGILPVDYYYKAMDLLKQKYRNLQFYIFSDDIDWVIENLKLNDFDHTFVSGNYSKTPIEDFYLIRQCKHHIIANSTFSWWSAWLCQYPDKQIIAPAKWFKNRNANTNDLLPESWLTL